MTRSAQEISDIIKAHKSELKPLTDKERRNLLNNRRSELQTTSVSLASNYVTRSVGLSVGPVIGNVAGGVTSSAFRSGLVATPRFNWLDFQQEKYNAELADELSSHPNLCHALREAGEIFEKAKSNCLNRETRNFESKVTSIQQIDSFVRLIIEALRIISLPEGAPLMLEINDVTAAISDCIKRCLESEITKGNMTIDQSKPIIKDGCIAWIKFEFQSSHSIESACCVTDKYAEVISTKKWFFFKDEKDFRVALFEAEKKLKK